MTRIEDLKRQLFTNSSVANGRFHRRGCGKVEHLGYRQLWVHGIVGSGTQSEQPCRCPDSLLELLRRTATLRGAEFCEAQRGNRQAVIRWSEEDVKASVQAC